ncbi:related to gibberellin cluster-GA14-synthase [Rhynchosporium secalis]|uniref:Related to gibberellin cluster-GA14-synthase n=1 Tax=Rhynchosporium secalis TaxID=38038 RepID=A0A1E1MJ52_RHYSE|nr:related to gibberellin cluster-GA14-synthase [Rhynchosporium secalis]
MIITLWDFQSLISRLQDTYPRHTISNLVFAAAATYLIWMTANIILYRRKLSSFPNATSNQGLFGIFSTKARTAFITDCANLVKRGFSMNQTAFRLRTDHSEVIVLSSRLAEDIRSEKRLSAGKYTETELMGHIPGFEPLGFAGTHRKLMHDVITTRLNRVLPKMPNFVSNEASDVLKSSWTDDKSFHKVHLYQTALTLIARVSILAFLGPDLCRNQRWVEINTQYTVVALGAVNALRKWPRFLLPMVHWFHPQVRATRALLNEARTILGPTHEKRARELAAGKEAPSDALTWFEELAQGQPYSYDPTVAQMTFTVASIHATTDMFCQILLDLTKYPEIVEALRKELLDVLKKNGWQQSSFSQLKLMDSVMKESQRLKPISQVFNKRVATDDIKLDEDLQIPKGAYIVISANNMKDPETYPEPEVFDAYRFIKRAENPEYAKSSSFSSVSVDHTGFGFGNHACPGRFYVTLELKILLAHIILRYDWKLPDGYEAKIFCNGFDTVTDMMAEILVRRRAEEIDVGLT